MVFPPSICDTTNSKQWYCHDNITGKRTPRKIIFGEEFWMDESLITTVHAVLQTTPARWQSLVAALPLERLDASPKAGEWSALSCLRHLVEAEADVFPVRVRRILAGEDFDRFDPDAAGAQDVTSTPEELIARFTTLRQASLELLATLTESDLARTARHQELGIVTLSELLHEWAGHDLMHTVQAEEALLQPFIAGAGPWRGYFVDHIAE
jgi:hypothetical protein